MGITDDLGGVVGEIGINTGGSFFKGLGTSINFLILFVGIALLAGVIIYFVMNKKNYHIKINIFEEVNGQTTPVGTDWAKEITIPESSIRIFKLKKRNLFMPRPTTPTGKNNYLYYIRNDHEWINFGLGNLNKELKELGINYDHTDMRYSNASLKKLIKQNYGDKNWLKEYAPYIALGFLVVIIGVSFYLIADKLGSVAGSLAGTADKMTQVLDGINRLSELQGGVSGIRPA